MRFWMPDCCWQLGLGPLISRNQEGLYRGIRHFECIEAIFQICAFSDLRFSAFRLFRLPAFSGFPPVQALRLFRPSTYSGSPLFQAFRLFRLSAFSGSLPFQTFCLFRLSASSSLRFSCIASKVSAIVSNSKLRLPSQSLTSVPTWLPPTYIRSAHSSELAS